MKIIRTFFVAIVLFLLTPNISFAALVSGMTSASQVYILNSIGYFNSIINANKSQYAPGETITLSGNINSTSVYGGDYLSMDMSVPPAAPSSVFSLSPVTMGNSKTINKTMTAPATPGPFTIVVWVVERMTANLGEASSITGTGYLNLNATLSASPTTCAIPLGQSFCNVSFTWNMGNSAYVQVPSLYNTTRATSYSSLASGTISGAVTYGANTVVARTSPSATQFADMASIVVTGTCAGVWSGGFCVAPAVPTVTVGAASSITTTGATLVANVASLGTPAAISARGTCWGTTPAPTTNCLADGLLTTGVFSQIRTGLTQGTPYYFRGYATNATGTGYSADGTFTTTATAVPTVTSPVSSSVTTTTAILGANVTSLGNPATISSRGTCWGTTPAPTTNCLAQGLLTTGLFSQTRTGLTQGTLYYYRGYATNATGTGYSADGTFTTIATAVPTVTTPTSASITTATATLGANVTSLGVPATISARGTCFATTPLPAINCLPDGGLTIGVISQTRTALTPGTLYYYRGYATNTTGTGYSADGTFMTVGIPDLTASVSTPTSATTGAAVTFSATVSNIGTASTGAGFSNFFQVATATNGGGTITGLTAVAVATLAAGANVVASSPSYTFPTVGTYSVRVCADKTSAASAGIITESSEGNNCGLWVDVVVVAPIKTVTLSPLSSSITLGQSITLSSTANFSTGNMTQHNIDWRKQGTTCWDWEVGCAVVASISPPNAAFAATGSHSISATFTPTQTGTYDIQAAAFDGSLPWTYAPSSTTYATVTVAPAPIVPCTEAAVIAWGSCVSSATCTTPPDTMIVSGTRVGFCAAGTNPASVVGTCANAVITCTAPIVTTSCGNSICELAGTPPETIMSCPADCHAPVQQF